jgi:hypothetical protein
MYCCSNFATTKKDVYETTLISVAELIETHNIITCGVAGEAPAVHPLGWDLIGIILLDAEAMFDVAGTGRL